MISLTHLLVGLILAYLLDKRLITASVFAIVPDFDLAFNFLYPFTTNGIMHSLLAASISTLLVYIYSEDRESAESSFLGFSSHLALDSLTYTGFPLFFPVFSNFSLGIASKTSITWNLGIITISLVAMFLKKNFQIFKPFLSFR